MSKSTFTLQDALDVQAEQLAEWKTKLNADCYSDLEGAALLSNIGRTDPYSIKRGSELACYIGNWVSKGVVKYNPLK